VAALPPAVGVLVQQRLDGGVPPRWLALNQRLVIST
jgi:hypothetical protein